MTERSPQDYKALIEDSGKDIYSPIPIGGSLWIPSPQLEALLNEGLNGLDLAGLPIRTRSKVVKEQVCRVLGYPVPTSFKKEQPRFPGQQLDTYIQKSMNLQIWNEELSSTRRYAIIQVSDDDKVLKTKVVTGQDLAVLDRTGTITTKYQARLEVGSANRELISATDTDLLVPHTSPDVTLADNISPVDQPAPGSLMPIRDIYERLSSLIGQSFPDPGTGQERNRGAGLHNLICEQLGYSRYEDNGQFPDIRHQLLEVKLQTSPTIDLGLVLPSSTEALDMPNIGGTQPRHCDTRYALFCAKTDNVSVTLTHLFLSTGADFFTRFKRFEGKVRNGKLQIPLPRDFFDK